MITNREEVLENAFRVFVRMNYEKASFTEIAKACGLSRAGIIHYYPYKQDLFVAVVDKFVFQTHHIENKFQIQRETLAEFIEQYLAGVTSTMKRIVALLNDGNSPDGYSPHFHYFHFIAQVRMYYPDIRPKIRQLYEKEYKLWESVIQKAKDSGEIRPDTDVQTAASLFRQIYLGLSYERSFLEGLNVEELGKNFRYLYSLLKA